MANAKSRQGFGGAKNGGDDGGKNGANGGPYARRRNAAKPPVVTKSRTMAQVSGGGQIGK
jgi:hypothetical protein